MAITIKPNKALARAVLPDGFLNSVKNGAPARAVPVGLLADMITAKQHEGRPFFHMWGGQQTVDDQPLTNDVRTLRFNALESGCGHMRGLVQAFAKAGASPTNGGVYLNSELNNMPAGSFTQKYPDEAFGNAIEPDLLTDTPIPSGDADEVIVGTEASLMIASLCLYEDTVIAARPEDVVGSSGFAAGGDILADKTNSNSTTAQLADRFQHVWQNRRPQIGWSSILTHFCDFTTSPQEWRFWGDQTIGEGGTAPSLAGPGFTLFGGQYAGAGRRQTVRVYLWVYARMTGNTDQGTLAIANRDTSGAMQPFIQVGGSGMITTDTFQWYPAAGGGFDPSTAPYFETPTNQAYDRVLLGARSSGATDTVQIADWMMAIYPSVA